MSDKDALAKRKLGLRYTRVAQDIVAIYDRLQSLSDDFRDQLFYETTECDEDIGPIVHWGRYTQIVLATLLDKFQDANTELVKSLNSTNPLCVYDPDIGME